MSGSDPAGRFSRPATAAELPAVWPAARACLLYDRIEQLEEQWEREPWTIRVSDAGDAAVVTPWREGGDILCIRGLWCPRARMGAWLGDLRVLAHEQGLRRLLGPAVEQSEIGPYLSAGMRVCYRLVLMSVDLPGGRPGAEPPPGVVLRRGVDADVAAVAAVDPEIFDEFWGYDEAMIARCARRDLFLVAERNGQVIGYTLATIRGPSASIGRLGVIPGQRRRGVGSALLGETISGIAGAGATRVTLCTQEDNAASRRLYRKTGFREAPGGLVAAMTEGD